MISDKKAEGSLPSEAEPFSIASVQQIADLEVRTGTRSQVVVPNPRLLMRVCKDELTTACCSVDCCVETNKAART